MVPDFLPVSANEIQDPRAIALLHQIQRQTVQVAFPQGITAIDTAFVHARISELRSGTHSPLLFLNGFDSSLLEFRRILPFLPAQDIWAIDLYGSGFTAYSAQVPVNPQTIRLHLQRTIADWIHEPVILIGASLGGAVALDFALHYPEWVKAIVLMDSVGFSGSFPIGQFLPVPLIELGTTWLHFRKQAALTAATLLSAGVLPIFPALDPRLADDLRCSLLHQEMPDWAAAIRSFTLSGGYSNLAEQISQIQQPTLILWGTADDILGIADAEKFRRAIPGSRLEWIQKAGHAPHLDQPQQVSDRILDFCWLQTH